MGRLQRPGWANQYCPINIDKQSGSVLYCHTVLRTPGSRKTSTRLPRRLKMVSKLCELLSARFSGIITSRLSMWIIAYLWKGFSNTYGTFLCLEFWSPRRLTESLCKDKSTPPSSSMAAPQASAASSSHLGIFGIDAFNHGPDKIMETFTGCLQESLRSSTGPLCWQANLVPAISYRLTFAKCRGRLATCP